MKIHHSPTREKPSSFNEPQPQTGTVQCKGYEARTSYPQPPLQLKKNNTGLPDDLKAGIQKLSGYSLDDVNVHYNSDKPAGLNALAYAQGADIYIAPGQEKHLAHEAWHVVQQKQGRVRATMQMKAKNINDDNALEHEADVMGSKSLTTEKAHNAYNHTYISQSDSTTQQATQFEEDLKINIPATAIQRKIAFAGLPPYDASALYEKVRDILEVNKHFLTPRELELISQDLKAELPFFSKVHYMAMSTEDYGQVTLDNPQHFLFFIKDYIKAGLHATEKEEDLDKQLEVQQVVWDKLKDTSPDPHHSYKTALLGTSASIAYYLNVNGRLLNPAETVIIGKAQPWDPSTANTESRGIDFVNHPMHMITPLRHQTTLPHELSGSDETFKGNSQKLSEDVEAVTSIFDNTVNTTIKKVSRLENKWYKIETDKGDFYAMKVISGLGMWRQKVDKKLSDQIQRKEQKGIEKKRVMDLDAFQRQLKDTQSDISQQHKARKLKNRTLSIGLAGPNAGVDAAYTATELGMVVNWVVTGGPAIAEGMANKIKRKKLVDLFFDYLNGWTISGKLVKMDISGKWRGGNNMPSPAEQRKTAGEAFLKKHPGWDVSDESSALVDYLVIAQGPDVSKVWNIFDTSVTKDLSLRFDKEGRFGAPEGTDLLKESIETSLLSSGYNVWEGMYERVKSVIPDKLQLWIRTTEHLSNESKKILKLKTLEFTNRSLQENVATGLGSNDESFEIIGGSAIRILNYLDLLKSRDKVPDKLKSGKTEEQMKKVMATLSSPTLLNNDQLTPIRSQIEASGKYMPGYIGTQESNFVTDDQTMIAAQIAAYYSNIPGNLANWVTQEIIDERHNLGIKPGSLHEGSRAFIDSWKSKLESLHQLFSRDHIKKVTTSLDA